jgi:hypothetical protein
MRMLSKRQIKEITWASWPKSKPASVASSNTSSPPSANMSMRACGSGKRVQQSTPKPPDNARLRGFSSKSTGLPTHSKHVLLRAALMIRADAPRLVGQRGCAWCKGRDYRGPANTRSTP